MMAYWATVAARLTQAGPLRGHGQGKQGSENGGAEYLVQADPRVYRGAADGVRTDHGQRLADGHVLATILDKTIVTTDALSRARFRGSGARFNIGCAIGGVQSLPTGVYIAMNGRIWHPAKVRENVAANLFEAA